MFLVEHKKIQVKWFFLIRTIDVPIYCSIVIGWLWIKIHILVLEVQLISMKWNQFKISSRTHYYNFSLKTKKKFSYGDLWWQNLTSLNIWKSLRQHTQFLILSTGLFLWPAMQNHRRRFYFWLTTHKGWEESKMKYWNLFILLNKHRLKTDVFINLEKLSLLCIYLGQIIQ